MKIRLALLFGGKSVEHEISIISALQAYGVLDKEKYDVVPVYITKDNEMYVGEDIKNIEKYKNIPALLKNSDKVHFILDGGKTYLVKYGKKAEKNDVIDIAFPVVHGTNVEDGTIAGFLKMYNLPFVGCDILSSAVGMNKYIMKSVFRDNGIPVLDAVKISVKEYDYQTESVIAKIEEKFGYPVIVKPIDLGSSVGIKKASDRDELKDALDNAFMFAFYAIVERAVENLREINCAVLGDRFELIASECEEPISQDQILSYNDKYIGDSGEGSKGMASLRRKIPADISTEMRADIQKYAKAAFSAIGAAGVARIDFLLDNKTGEIFLNEINTIPGSLSFYLWEPLGITYANLCELLIQIALRKRREDNKLIYSFDTNVLDTASLGLKGSKKV